MQLFIEIEGRGKKLYFKDNEKEVVVSAISTSPDDYTKENLFIVKGLVENNGLGVYNPNSTIYRFLEDKLLIPCKGTQCCHSYDCCGQFYANHIDIKRVDYTTWLCSQKWKRNV